MQRLGYHWDSHITCLELSKVTFKCSKDLVIAEA